MAFKLEYYDLVTLLEAKGHDNFTAKVVADYLDECIDYDMDLSLFLGNGLLFNVQVFKTKEEAEKYVDEELCCSKEDCTIWEGNFGTYLEWY